MLVSIPIERDEGDVDGWIAPEALKAARKLDKQSPVASIQANGACVLSNGAHYPRPLAPKEGEIAQNYPNCTQVMPREKTDVSLVLNPSLLLKIAQGLGSEESVKISFNSKDLRDGVLSCNALRIEAGKTKNKEDESPLQGMPWGMETGQVAALLMPIFYP